MQIVREFTYKNIECRIVYYSDLKSYTLLSVIDGKTDKAITLFPASRKTDNQSLIAFHVANLHILPTWY